MDIGNIFQVLANDFRVERRFGENFFVGTKENGGSTTAERFDLLEGSCRASPLVPLGPLEAIAIHGCDHFDR